MSKVTILVVDDANFIRDLVKKGLRDHFPNAHIEDVATARRAQQTLMRTPYDLILCDWEMPEMSGIELLQWVRQQDSLSQTPFIMITSRGDKANVVEAIQAGVSDYIGKPFSNDQLISKVKKAMQRVGKLNQLMAAPARNANTPFVHDTVQILTRNPVDSAQASAPARQSTADSSRSSSENMQAQAVLRLASTSFECSIKSLSLKGAVILIRRTEILPAILETVVLDLEHNGGLEVARLNGYVQMIAAVEQTPASQWLQVSVLFMDDDPQKMEYLSRLIARGTAHRQYIPGA